jgi:hypothetical protein
VLKNARRFFYACGEPQKILTAVRPGRFPQCQGRERGETQPGFHDIRNEQCVIAAVLDAAHVSTLDPSGCIYEQGASRFAWAATITLEGVLIEAGVHVLKESLRHLVLLAGHEIESKNLAVQDVL